MLTREDLEEIIARYHRSDWEGFSREQAVLDIGRLVGHAMDLAEQLAVQQDALSGLSRQWNDQRDARLAAEERIAALEAAGDVAAEALVEADGALVFLEACGDPPRWRLAQHARITATNARFIWRAARHGIPGGEEGDGGR